MKSLLLALTLLNGHHVYVDPQDIWDVYTDGRKIWNPYALQVYECKVPGSAIIFRDKPPICVKELVIRSIKWVIYK